MSRPRRTWANGLELDEVMMLRNLMFVMANTNPPPRMAETHLFHLPIAQKLLAELEESLRYLEELAKGSEQAFRSPHPVSLIAEPYPEEES